MLESNVRASSKRGELAPAWSHSLREKVKNAKIDTPLFPKP